MVGAMKRECTLLRKSAICLTHGVFVHTKKEMVHWKSIYAD